MNQSYPEIHAVIFDMDGLMLDTERIAQEAWQQAGQEWGFELPDEIYLQAVGRTAKDTGMIFRSAFGPDFPFDAMYDRKQALLHQAIEEGNVPTKPGLFELLDFLEERQMPKAVATSTARPVALTKLTKTKLLGHFPVIVCGNEVAIGKPAPDIFLVAAEQLGANPATTLVLEDSVAGIKAAHAAGMIPVNIPDLKEPSDEVRALAYRILSNLHEVKNLLFHS
ncbi:MAG: HAD family phosphatase [Chloroflexota bacterium]